jgi:hypothetical protein
MIMSLRPPPLRRLHTVQGGGEEGGGGEGPRANSKG